MKIDSYKNFKVGDRFIIKRVPYLWDSSLNDHHPLDEKYPYEGVIKEIRLSHIGTSMTDGKYGFALDHLISDNNIFTLRTLRRDKLIKLGT